ncbi:hypothetical protein LB530_13105 [Mesorhizobium sp. CO1-1-3]|uniref:hypothetical protein n=1 Tax=Mesorhizobium sp. CO1-1-3 TaxID=2876634 RepID=UPI0021E337DF|nr:hypothetical protein [Mesorhizobium sp. CO1-1-3]MBZ9701811.1 hypothetical protein [Mesorhizobium sp. CO1-1-3]
MYSFGLEFRRRVLLADGAVSLSVRDHTRITDGFEKRDAAAAVGVMEKHLVRIRRTMRDAMNS